MELSVLGLLLQTIGAALLALVLLYLSRGDGNRVLRAAGYAWVFLYLALASLFLPFGRELPLPNLPYQYLKLLYMAALVIAALRMDRAVRLGKSFGIAALGAAPAAFGIVRFTGEGSLFYAVHTGVLATGWLLVATLIFRSHVSGLGKQFAGFMALLTFLA